MTTAQQRTIRNLRAELFEVRTFLKRTLKQRTMLLRAYGNFLDKIEVALAYQLPTRIGGKK